MFLYKRFLKILNIFRQDRKYSSTAASGLTDTTPAGIDCNIYTNHDEIAHDETIQEMIEVLIN